MKKVIFLLIMVFTIGSIIAQQKTLNYISNDYVILSNELKTLYNINTSRNDIYKQYKGYNYPYQVEEVDGYSSHFSIFYQNKKGYINIMFRKNEGPNSAVEEDLDKYYRGMLLEDDPSDYIIDYVKTSAVHGGFFFNKKSNTIYIFMRSQPKRDFIQSIVMINLTPEQKIAFAKDFILKTKFK